jgi:hypothetical protein
VTQFLKIWRNDHGCKGVCAARLGDNLINFQEVEMCVVETWCDFEGSGGFRSSQNIGFDNIRVFLHLTNSIRVRNSEKLKKFLDQIPQFPRLLLVESLHTAQNDILL